MASSRCFQPAPFWRSLARDIHSLRERRFTQRAHTLQRHSPMSELPRSEGTEQPHEVDRPSQDDQADRLKGLNALGDAKAFDPASAPRPLQYIQQGNHHRGDGPAVTRPPGDAPATVEPPRVGRSGRPGCGSCLWSGSRSQRRGPSRARRAIQYADGNGLLNELRGVDQLTEAQQNEIVPVGYLIVGRGAGGVLTIRVEGEDAGSVCWADYNQGELLGAEGPTEEVMRRLVSSWDEILKLW